jgi:glycosyltransferase involved in cell wall biosynthesis
MGQVRRIFVDFSGIDHRTRVTGIPRVSYAYLEEGYALQEALNLRVIPVQVRDGTLVDVRPLLVQSNLRRFRRRPSVAAAWQLARSGLYFGLHVLRLLAVSCITPFFVLARGLLTFEFFDLWRNLLLRVFTRLYAFLKRAVNRAVVRPLGVRPGDILFMPAWWHDTPPGHFLRLRAQGVVLCPLVHDVLPITHPQHYESPWRGQFRLWTIEVLAHADHVYFVSEVTRQQVAAVLRAQVQRPTAAGTVIHHGHDFATDRRSRPRSPAVRALLQDPSPFVMMVGSIEPKKNHLAVLEELERLWSRGLGLRLLIVGGGGWKDADIRARLERHPARHVRLFWLDAVKDADLRLLYRRAHALVQASEAEGFGLPLIEALALGSRVLANDLPVFRELCGTHAEYFRIHRRGELAGALTRLLEQRLVEVPRFTWPSWSERARFLYEHLLQVDASVATAGSAHSRRSQEASG